MKRSASIYRIRPIDDCAGIGIKGESARMREAERTRSRRGFQGMPTGRQRPRVGVEPEAVEMSDPGCGNLSVMPRTARRVEEK
ncbi:hypothetical protein A8E97_19590 [Burkholderia cenocepacia]|uniref:Uncharacterized protein n=1 Tax=Burkholderia cenocepacia TaxID=95486 RepID=A0A427NP94_9BURK|nr:hypothetical protein A8E88_32010 [Burkholderia cenocepacia]ONV86820.1 hypothetical protein A8E89_23035 [Burkholderia cenocepacia]ONW19819.1 hypothetical protein A8E90_12150 [Burkholderia cenocepacia]ONW21750.1 hypothetical protein A8E94_03480 [Burkholderia cenocepacia]ONW31192.1 hypothetical protein A8E99_34865 [Burkholderia cenocepacia]